MPLCQQQYGAHLHCATQTTPCISYRSSNYVRTGTLLTTRRSTKVQIHCIRIHQPRFVSAFLHDVRRGHVSCDPYTVQNECQLKFHRHTANMWQFIHSPSLSFWLCCLHNFRVNCCTEQTNICLIVRICYVIHCLYPKYCYKCVLIQYILLLIKILECYIIINISVKMCRSFAFSRHTIFLNLFCLNN